MYLHHFKISTRNLLREKTSTIIKISGLTLGFTIFLLLISYVGYQKNFDTYFSNFENVSRLAFLNTSESGQIWNSSSLPVPLVRTALQEFPEIENATRIYLDDNDALFYHDEKVFETKSSYFVDSTFFKVFNVDLIVGNKALVLSEPNVAAISKSTAQKIFGSANPIGQTIKYRNQTPLKITGIFEDIPKNSSFNFDILMSFTTPNYLHPNNENDWDLHFVKAFFLLKPEVDREKLAQKISAMASLNKPVNSRNSIWKFYFEPISKIHLETKVISGKESKVNSKTINLLLFIAYFIFAIALINHLNLSVTQVVKRIKQITVEKTLGQKKSQLFFKSISESAIIFIISFIISLLASALIIPAINSVLNENLSINLLNLKFTGIAFSVLALGILLAALFELIFVFKINASKNCSAKNSLSNKGTRKVLIAFQFTVSLLLIFITLVFYVQTKYMFNRDLGMANNNVLVIKGRTISSWGNANYIHELSTFKQELLNHPEIDGITSSNVIPGQFSFTDGVCLASDPNRHFVINSIIQTDADYINTYSIKLIAGTTFPISIDTKKNAAIINEECAKRLGFDTPEEAIGKKIIREYFNNEYEVVGVTENFAVSNLIASIMPTTLYNEPNENRFYSIKYNTGSPSKIISEISQTWKKVFKEDFCMYFFLENAYQKVYSNEYLQVKIYSICSLMTVIIACIGLFGLAFYSIIQRTKEIGVRKVNGAKTLDILSIIYKEYFNIILLAAIPGLTTAYIIATKWLENYYFKIQIGILFFIIPMVLMVIVTVITISYHALRAARKNPIEALRYE